MFLEFCGHLSSIKIYGCLTRLLSTLTELVRICYHKSFFLKDKMKCSSQVIYLLVSKYNLNGISELRAGEVYWGIFKRLFVANSSIFEADENSFLILEIHLLDEIDFIHQLFC